MGIAAGLATRLEDSHIADAKDLEWDMNHANAEPEWVLPVRWISTVPLEEAVWKKGMFANQISACRLRDSFTLENLHSAFGVDESTASGIEAVNTVDDHRKQIDDPNLQAAFDAIIDQTTALSPGVTIVPGRFYIAECVSPLDLALSDRSTKCIQGYMGMETPTTPMVQSVPHLDLMSLMSLIRYGSGTKTATILPPAKPATRFQQTQEALDVILEHQSAERTIAEARNLWFTLNDCAIATGCRKPSGASPKAL